MKSKAPQVPETDVCLILEGTYPYVAGGVSAWVDDLIKGMPETTFSLLSILPNRDEKRKPRYALPPNVRAFAEVFIHELVADPGRRCPRREREAAWDVVRAYHDRGPDRDPDPHHDRTALARQLLLACAHPQRQALGVTDAIFSRTAWDLVVSRYNERARDTSFIDYYWTWRAVHAPLFQTLIAETPPARVYHTISTGYAGLLGAVAKLRTGRPLILTEHGIYVRERMIDIARAAWIYEEPVRLKVHGAAPSPLKEMWTRFFVALGEITYAESDLIISLFTANQRLQHTLGADPSRTRVIPNGIDSDRFLPLRAERPEARPGAPGRPLRVGFVGRVVPIKDVKTFIKACHHVTQRRQDVECWLIGPDDEDPTYAAECRELAARLDVKRLVFKGRMDPTKIYPQIDVMVLTSLSEAQPLTILEAACAGVASVAPDIGDCRALIEGRTEEDRRLGPIGIVTGMGDPEGTGQAILQILSDAALRRRMSEAGRERVMRHYQRSQLVESYRSIYLHYGRRYGGTR